MLGNIDCISLKISIITIVRNGMPFVEQTIKSVLVQTYKNIEYIVIDGASTDGTQAMIESHIIDGASIVYRSESDAGIADAFNKGLSLATGDYLLFLNADDMLIGSEIISKVAENIMRENCPVIMYGDCEVVERETSNFLYRATIKFSKKAFLRGKILPHPSTFTSNKYFEKYGEFDKNFKIAMDYEFFLRGVIKESIVHSPLLITRVRDGGISTRNQDKVVSEIILALKKNGYMNSLFDLNKLRAYYLIRRKSKKMLQFLAVYDLLNGIRNKLQRIK